MTSPDPSWPTALVTLGDVANHLNLNQDSPNFDQTKLTGFLNAATAFIQDLTGPIVPQQFTEVYSGGSPLIVLFNPPVLQVTSVLEYIGPTVYTLTECELGADTGAYSFSVDNAAQGVICRRYNGGLAGPFAGGLRNIQVTYWAGQATVPADIRMAVLQDIAGLYQPSQLGANPYYNDQATGNGPLNPIGLFPRVAEILSAPTMRVPAIG